MEKKAKIIRTPQKEVDAMNKRLKKHFKGKKSPPHEIKVHGMGNKKSK